MIVINKKRISLILSCIFVSLLAFSFKIANKNENVGNFIGENNSVVETVATPTSGKTVVLDARTSEFQMRGIAY